MVVTILYHSNLRRKVYLVETRTINRDSKSEAWWETMGKQVSLECKNCRNDITVVSPSLACPECNYTIPLLSYRRFGVPIEKEVIPEVTVSTMNRIRKAMRI